MSPTIRRLLTADIPALRQLFLDARLAVPDWPERESLRLDDFDAATQDEPILVATLGEQIVGFVSWWPPDNFVHNLFVDPNFQRQGIGPQLLHACLAEIGRPATLKCLLANTRAIAFYERLGWKGIGLNDVGCGVPASITFQLLPSSRNSDQSGDS